MKKKFICKVIFIFLFIICICNIKSYASSDFTYELDNDNHATITSYQGSNKEITIPSTIDGYAVKGIGEHIFDRESPNGKMLTKVIISEGITTIGDFAFAGCTNIESIKLPESLTSLGDQTFIRCSKLKEINIPSKITKFGYTGYMFQETGFEEFSIPENINNIPSCTFRACSNLKRVKVSSKNVVYGEKVFEHCPTDLVLYGYKDSTTEEYAKNNNITFKDIENVEEQSGSQNTYKGFEIIGKINIPKIQLEYPVLKKVSRKSLEVSVAALYPQEAVLNSIGNVVIIGHNFRNGTFFSRNDELSLGDEIYITGLNNDKVTYYIYKIFETNDTDTSFYNRDTNGKKEITLSTATDDGQKRLVILAGESKYVQEQKEDETKEESEEREEQPSDGQSSEGKSDKKQSSEKEDNAKANKILPYTGSRYILGIIIIIMAFIIFILYNKLTRR